MNTSFRFATAFCAVVFLFAGCSHGYGPTSPVFDESAIPSKESSEIPHNLLGLWTFVCNPGEASVEIIKLREADLHLNALKFLEPPPLVYLTLESQPQFNGNILDVDIGLRNPYLGLDQFTGFDVCGIILTHGSVTGFHDSELAVAGKGDTRLLNADGYTRWWNPAEFPHGSTIFDYIDGMLGTPAESADFNCTINGYKYFADGLDKDDPLTTLDPVKRGMFGAGKMNVRHYTIDMSGGLIFNYSVDACWKKPQGAPPIIAPDDFPPMANRPEAYNLVVNELENSLYYVDNTSFIGGSLSLRLKVWDHFNGMQNTVYGESLAGLPYTEATKIGNENGYIVYELEFSGEDLIQNGEADLLITVQSEATGYGDILPGESVCAYFTHSFDISPEVPEPGGWARTWGGGHLDKGCGMVADSQGNLYVTGYFADYVDFDPGDGIEALISQDEADVFLSKFDNDGNFQWVRGWGALGIETGYAIDVDSSDDLFVTGYFSGDVDFDPGPGVNQHVSKGETDAFLCKYNSDGDLLWVRTWGGIQDDAGYNIWVDNSDNLCVSGYFSLEADLNPGMGINDHVSQGDWDSYISKFDNDGNFLWARSWGGNADDLAHAVAVNGAGDIYVAGSFHLIVDFDPGLNVVEHSSAGGRDAYLSMFDSDGEFQWALVWGGSYQDLAKSVAFGADDSIYVGGVFSVIVDFDPGPGSEIYHSAVGSEDAFITKFLPDGQHEWARTWGGFNPDDCRWISISGDNVFATGYFQETCDFDPSSNVDEHTSNGLHDFFLSKFDSLGNYQWVRTWGSWLVDHSRCVTSDNLGNLFISGSFEDELDFDPGPGVDVHVTNGGWDIFMVKMLPSGYW